MKEIWKDIKITQKGIFYDFTGRYQVSNFGNVVSIIRNKEKPKKMKTYIHYKTGYEYIHLVNTEGRSINFQVHRLVATMFVPNKNPSILIQVNHKDLNPLNNNADNLEWCTAWYNAQLSNKSEKTKKLYTKGGEIYNRLVNMQKEAGGKGVEKIKVKVNQYSLDGKFIKTYESYVEAARSVGLKYDTSIRRCCKGEIHTARGYKWERALK